MDQTVTRILNEKYKISAKPSEKVKCPFCRHKTFSIKSDDTLAKCFHPSCGRFITPGYQFDREGVDLHPVLEKVFHDFHSILMAQKDLKEKHSAYDWVVNTRNIHSDVVKDSMLGAIPKVYDLNPLFGSIKIKANTKYYKDEEQNDEINPEDWLNETKRKLARCLKGKAGWLCFFYTDSTHRIVAVRFRKPFSKNVVYFKPYKSVAGLFGHGLFSFNKIPDLLGDLEKHLIVTEGEFNQLQLQSLYLRYLEATGQPSRYLFVCAVGGVTNADYKTIKRVCQKPIICYDNDENGAGFFLVKNALEFMSVSAFTTPENNTDLDEFILSFDNDCITAWNSVQSLLNNRETYYRSYEGLRIQIRFGRKRPKTRPFEIDALVAGIIRSDLNERGSFYNDEQSAYFFLDREKQLIEIHADDDNFMLIIAKYGINRSERLFQYLLEDLYREAFENGKKTKIHRLAYYNPETFTVYLFNHNNQTYRISPDEIELLDNGTDGVLFLSDSSAKPFEITTLEHSKSPVDDIIFSNINLDKDVLIPNERRMLLIFWFYCLFFESLMPTKPILAFIGEKGSGKTTALRKIGMLLFGEDFNVTSITDDPKDFDAAVTNSVFVVLDNADVNYKWFDDKITVTATGGKIKKRQLYTTNKLVDFKINCFLSITSRTPEFRRDDVADRLLIMNVKRIKRFKSERYMLDEIIKNRELIMSEVVSHLQEIAGALKENKDITEIVTFRMADFADFALAVARYAGVYDDVKLIFERLVVEQSYFTIEGNPFFQLLSRWVPKNEGKEISTADLCNELSELAKDCNINFDFKGKTQAFGQRLSNLQDNLSEFFEITKRTGKARKTFYTFKPKPRLFSPSSSQHHPPAARLAPSSFNG